MVAQFIDAYMHHIGLGHEITRNTTYKTLCR